MLYESETVSNKPDLVEQLNRYIDNAIGIPILTIDIELPGINPEFGTNYYIRIPTVTSGKNFGREDMVLSNNY